MGQQVLDSSGRLKGLTPVTYRKVTAKTVNTTASATDLLNGEITVAAGVMGSDRALRITALGDAKNNSGGTLNAWRFQLVFGGTTLFDTGAPAWATENTATRYPWRFAATIQNITSGSQVTVAELDIGYGGVTASVGAALTTGAGNYVLYAGSASKSNGKGLGYLASSLDTTTAKALVLNIINPSASANCETVLQSALVEIV